MEQIDQVPDGGLEIEFRSDAAGAATTDVGCQLWIVEHAAHRGHQRSGIPGGDEQTGLAMLNKFRNAADVRRNDRTLMP